MIGTIALLNLEIITKISYNKNTEEIF